MPYSGLLSEILILKTEYKCNAFSLICAIFVSDSLNNKEVLVKINLLT
jgi:hypothetical protein